MLWLTYEQFEMCSSYGASTGFVCEVRVWVLLQHLSIWIVSLDHYNRAMYTQSFAFAILSKTKYSEL